MNKNEFKTAIKKPIAKLIGNLIRSDLLLHSASTTSISNSLGLDLGKKRLINELPENHIAMIMENIPDAIPLKEQYGTEEGYWRWTKEAPQKARRLIFQLLLVFIVAVFENFIEDILFLVFRTHMKCLKSGKSMTWEQVIDFNDINVIIDYMAAEKTKEVLGGDWEKVVVEFNKLFKIDLNTGINNQVMAEIFELRHVIVHNLAVPDERFFGKINKSSLGMTYSMQQEIAITKKVLDKITIFITKAAEYITLSLVDKFNSESA